MNLISKIKRKINKFLHPICGEILTLHRVVEHRSRLEENRIMEITPAFLEQTILKYQSAGYRFVSLDEVQRQVENRKHNRRKFVCFTLDDGYADNYEYAYPVFKKYYCPFAVYVTTDYPDQKAQFWWYQLEEVLLKNEKIVINGVKYDCSDLEKKNRAFWDIREAVYSSVETLKALEQIFQENECGVNVHALSWEQIAFLAADPLCTIGAHTVTHASLPVLSDEQIRKELMEGKKKIEDNIKKPVKHFSYPYGNRDDRVTGLVMEPFNTAVINKGSFVRKGDSVYLLNRNVLIE